MPSSAGVDAYDGRLFTGRVATVNRRVDPVTRTVAVRAIIENDDGMLLPGLLMSIELTKQPRPALLIPEGALLQRGSRTFVYAVNDDGDGPVVREKEVVTGARVPGQIEIESGLEQGEQVVVHGLMRIRDGLKVQIRGILDGDDKPLTDFTGDRLRNNGAM